MAVASEQQGVGSEKNQGFDVVSARKAGYSDQEILQELAKSKGFDLSSARKSGYSNAEIFKELTGTNSIEEEGEKELTLGRTAGLVARGGGRGLVSGAGALAGASTLAPFGAPLGPFGVAGMGIIGAIGGGLGVDYLVGDKIEEGMDYLGAPRAQNKTEKVIQGVSNAAASVASPMGAVKGLAKLGAENLIPAAVKTATMAEPAMQFAASTTGAAVSESTDNPILGLLAGVSLPLVKRFGAGYFKDPKALAAKLWKDALAIKDADGNVVGYHAADSDVGLQLRQQLEGENGTKHLVQLLENEKAKLGSTIPADANTSLPVEVGQSNYNTLVQQSQAALRTAAEDAKNAAVNLTPPVNTPRSQLSEQLAGKIESLKEKSKAIERKLWEPLNDDRIRIDLGKKGGFNSAIEDMMVGRKKNVSAGRPEDIPALTISEKEILAPYLKNIADLGDNTSLREMQSLRSDLLTQARDANTPDVAKRLLYKLTGTIDSGLDAAVNTGKFTSKVKNQYASARAFTKERAQKFDGTYLENVFKEKAAPSEMLGKIVAGQGDKERVDELLYLLEPFKHPAGSVANVEGKALAQSFTTAGREVDDLIEKHLTTELISKLGVEQIGDPNKINTFLKTYEDVLNARPALKSKFGNIQSAQNTAFKAAKDAADEVNAQQVAEVSPFFNVKMDSKSPSAIKSAFKNAFDSNDADSISKILGEIPAQNTDARNGLKRIALDHLINQKDLHEVISDPKNLAKLNQIFDTPDQQQLLQKISESSRLLDRYGKVDKVEQEEIKKLLSNYGFLPALLGKARAYTTYGISGATLGVGVPALVSAAGLPMTAITGIAGAAGVQVLGGLGQLSKKATAAIGGAKRDAVVNVLKEAFVNPTRARELYTPQSSDAAKYLIPMLSGTRGALVSKEDENSNVQKKADGGPVYTHPAISSIRANRAVSRMAS